MPNLCIGVLCTYLKAKAEIWTPHSVYLNVHFSDKITQA